jgi:hypothetical protein
VPDYADWTESIELLGTEIQVPIDVQGAFIQVPVDIQGQFVDLTVDIVAQTVGNITIDIAAQSIGNINVKIAASAVTLNVAIQSSAVTLNVNISSQTSNININIAAQAGNVTIEVKAQTVAVKTQGEWSPQAGQQKYVTGSGSNLANGVAAYVDYSVPTGKSLYITHFGFSIGATVASNGDLPQIGRCSLYNYSTGTDLAWIGGNGGSGLSFPTPIKLTTAQVIRIIATNLANHSCNIWLCWGGYEL